MIVYQRVNAPDMNYKFRQIKCSPDGYYFSYVNGDSIERIGFGYKNYIQERSKLIGENL